jgi:hypothetical protein
MNELGKLEDSISGTIQMLFERITKNIEVLGDNICSLITQR